MSPKFQKKITGLKSSSGFNSHHEESQVFSTLKEIKVKNNKAKMRLIPVFRSILKFLKILNFAFSPAS